MIPLYTTDQTNGCTAWDAKVSGELVPEFNQESPKIFVAARPRKAQRLYCYAAKSVDNMFLWHGINNEQYYTGDRNALVSTISLAFVPVFLNLPNQCTACVIYPLTNRSMFGGPDCGTILINPTTALGFRGIAPKYGVCTGGNLPCAVPADWTGRGPTDCYNGEFDFTTFTCVCDEGGWTNNDPFLPVDAKTAGFTQGCKYNYCTDLALGVSDLNQVCSGRGTCLGASGICRCDVNSTWAGRICNVDRSTACIDRRIGVGSNFQNCGGHGTCIVALNGTSYCECKSFGGAGGFWNGTYCMSFHTPDDYACTNNGGTVALRPGTDVPYCSCPIDRGGQYCEFSRCPIANGKLCNEQGVCTVDGTNAAGYPKRVCRQPLPDSIRCPALDEQCLRTKSAPAVCSNGRDYGGCACEQPIRALCTPPSDPEAPLCDATEDLVDQLARCQVYTDLSNGTTTFRCQCPNSRKGLWCEASVCGDCNGQVSMPIYFCMMSPIF